jgi:hypothetical protein
MIQALDKHMLAPCCHSGLDAQDASLDATYPHDPVSL